jgi:hypothetical protein
VTGVAAKLFAVRAWVTWATTRASAMAPWRARSVFLGKRWNGVILATLLSGPAGFLS